MQTKGELKDYITLELASGVKIGNLDEDESLLESGIIDSMGMVQLIVFLEDKYMIKIDDEELIPENFESINAIWHLIQQKAG